METRDLGTWTVRETDTQPDGVAATLDGVAVPYGTEIIVGGIREQFAAGSFDINDVIGRPLAWRHDEPIGRITDANNTPTGLHVTAEIADTTMGRDAATLARMGGMGLSVGFEPVSDAWTKTRDGVTRIKAILRELSLTHMPAYATAGVGAIREDQEITVEDTTTPPVAEATVPDLAGYARSEDVAALERQVAALTITDRPTEPVTEREFLQTYFEGLVNGRRAWTDITLDGSASDYAPPPSLVASINFGRPTVAAIGVSQLGATGMDSTWITDATDPAVAEQVTEKTEIASNAAGGSLITAPVKTYAGGADISIQFIERASGWTYEQWLRRAAEQYARQTDLAVLSTLSAYSAGSTVPAALDTAIIGGLLGGAAAQIASATGRAPQLVVLEPELFFEIGVVAGASYPLAGGNVGNADLASLTYSAFGLQFVADPNLASTTTGDVRGYVIDRSSVGIRESAGAPFTMTANVPSKLGQDTAVFGYMANALLNADGVHALVHV
jgi:HK97 family phage prohead protease